MTWYSVVDEEAQQRLEAAWEDAPIENLEVLGMLLTTAREQVIAYAPKEPSGPPNWEPVLLSQGFGPPTGYTVTAARTDDVVTVSITGSAGTESWIEVGFPLLAQFIPAISTAWEGLNQQISVQALTAEFAGSWWGEDSAGIFIAGRGSFEADLIPAELSYFGAPTDDAPPPERYVLAQLKQAENLWNAGRTAGTEGTLGGDTFTFTPRPLDRTIRQMIRPVSTDPMVL